VVEIELACRFQRSQSKAWLERTPPGGPRRSRAPRFDGVRRRVGGCVGRRIHWTNLT